MSVAVHHGDCRDLLKAMPDESVHCIVTSPPYWGLRSYLPDDHPDKPREIGLEPTLSQHLTVLTAVFRDVRRVLRKDGTCWINYGDCYATTPNGRSAKDTKAAGNDDRTFRDKPFSTIQGKMKPKDLCMVANRLAIALQDDGWWVRSEIIWSKPNPMPESVTDRPACSHEKMWLLTKSQRYWYDADAVLQPVTGGTHARVSQNIAKQIGSARANGGRKTNGNMKAVVRSPKITAEGSGIKNNASFINAVALEVLERNLRNVWTIPTAGYSEAHYATFPPALVEPCIKAGCPVGGIVLDPFGGSGTVGMVADRLQRNAILFELNPDGLAERRLRSDGGMFMDVTVSS